MQKTISSPWCLETSPLALSALTIGPEGKLEAPAGKRVLMTVDHVLTDPAPGTYAGNILLTLADDMPKLGDWENDYRSALLITEAGVQASGCALDAVTGQLSDTALVGGTIQTAGHVLNGLTVTGGTYRVTGTRFTMNGNGGDDFQLWGSAVAVWGQSSVILDGVDIQTRGVIATSVAAAGSSRVVVKDSVIRSFGTDNDGWYAKHPHLSETPWVLGIRGTLRATNVLDAANVTYYNCDCTCNGWGVLSTDGTKDAVHNIINTKARIPAGNDFGSGYGAYILGGVTSTFLGAELEAPDFCFAVGGNNHPITVGSSTPENLEAAGDRLLPLKEALGGSFASIEARPSIIRSPRFIGMWHHQSTEPFYALPGTILEAGDTAFLIKSGGMKPNGPEINCDGVSITAPRIVHLMETDDAGMGTRTHDACWAPCMEFYPDAPAPAPDGYDPTAEGEAAAHLNLNHMTLSGDSFNTRRTGGQTLVLTLTDTRLTGTISAGISRHRSFSYGILKNPDGSRTCTDPQGRKYLTERLDDLLFGKMPVTSYVPKEDGQGGFVYDDTDTTCHPLDGYGLYYTDPQKVADVDITPCHTPTTGVLVHLTAGSAWTVSGDSFITGLSIAQDCRVLAPQGKTLTVTCNGLPLDLVPGTYRGQITLRVQ